jgi:hypothetical protein
VSGKVANFGTLIASALGGLLEIDSSAVVNGGAATIGNGVIDVLAGGLTNISFLSLSIRSCDSAGLFDPILVSPSGGKCWGKRVLYITVCPAFDVLHDDGRRRST